MASIVIGKNEYEVIETQLNQDELLFYNKNPRVYSILRSNGNDPTQADIEAQMKSMEHVKQLRYSIEQNGGLIDPLIVIKMNDEYVVLEGNSRLAAYRILADKDPIKWQKVRANILPDTITEEEIFTLLGQYHLVGRKDWSIFEQAAYLHRQKQASQIETDILAKNVGLTTGKVNSLIRVYEFMYEHDDLRPDRWSYYGEYLKNRGIQKYRETFATLDDVFVKQVKTGKIKQAIDVRDKLGKMAKATDTTTKRIMKDFIEERNSLEQGFDRFEASGRSGDSFQQLKRFKDKVTSLEFTKSLKKEAVANKGATLQELRKIRQAVEKLIKEIDQN